MGLILVQRLARQRGAASCGGSRAKWASVMIIFQNAFIHRFGACILVITIQEAD